MSRKTLRRENTSKVITQKMKRIKDRLETADKDEYVRARYGEAKEMAGRFSLSPAAAVLIANTLALKEFESEDKKKEFEEKVSEKIETNTDLMNVLLLMVTSVSADINRMIQNYMKEIKEVEKNYDRRVREIWNVIPDLSLTWKNVASKLASTGIATGFWFYVVESVQAFTSTAGAYIISTVAAALAFLFSDRVFLRLVSGIGKAVDRLVTTVRKALIRMKYRRKKVEELWALAFLVYDELTRRGYECTSIDKKMIKRIGRTLPR